MDKEYITNPTRDRISKELVIRDGSLDIITSYSLDSSNRYVKLSLLGIDRCIKLFEGNNKAQIVFIIAKMLYESKEIDKVSIRFKIINEILKEVKAKLWNRSQLSKAIRWLLDEQIVFRDENQNMYWVNTEYLSGYLVEEYNRV